MGELGYVLLKGAGDDGAETFDGESPFAPPLYRINNRPLDFDKPEPKPAMSIRFDSPDGVNAA